MKNEKQIAAIKRHAAKFLETATQLSEGHAKHFPKAITHSDYIGYCNTSIRYPLGLLTKQATDRAAKVNAEFGVKADFKIPTVNELEADFEGPYNTDAANYRALHADPARPFWDRSWIQFDATGKPYLVKDFDKILDSVCTIPDTARNKQVKSLQDQLIDIYQKAKALDLELIGTKGLIQTDNGQPVANNSIFQR